MTHVAGVVLVVGAVNVHGRLQLQIGGTGLSLAVEHVKGVRPTVLHVGGEGELPEGLLQADGAVDASQIEGELVVEENPEIIVTHKLEGGGFVIDKSGVSFDAEAPVAVTVDVLVVTPAPVVDRIEGTGVDAVDSCVLVQLESEVVVDGVLSGPRRAPPPVDD